MTLFKVFGLSGCPIRKWSHLRAMKHYSVLVPFSTPFGIAVYFIVREPRYCTSLSWTKPYKFNIILQRMPHKLFWHFFRGDCNILVWSTCSITAYLEFLYGRPMHFLPINMLWHSGMVLNHLEKAQKVSK